MLLSSCFVNESCMSSFTYDNNASIINGRVGVIVPSGCLCCMSGETEEATRASRVLSFNSSSRKLVKQDNQTET